MGNRGNVNPKVAEKKILELFASIEKDIVSNDLVDDNLKADEVKSFLKKKMEDYLSSFKAGFRQRQRSRTKSTRKSFRKSVGHKSDAE